MNKPIVSRLLMLSGLLLVTSLPTYAAISSKITQTGDLSKAIAHSVIDKNGTVMVAQGAATNGTNNEKQIARLAFKRAAGKNEAEFTGIANGASLQNKAISALSLSPSGLPVAAQGDFKVAALTGIADATKIPLVSDVLKDASQPAAFSADVRGPITGVVSTGDYLLTAVCGRSNTGYAYFGDVDGGLALVRVNAAGTALEQIKYDGTTGAQYLSFKVDIKNTGGATAKQVGLVAIADDVSAVPATSTACMCYDEHLDVAYLGVGHMKLKRDDTAKAVALVLAELADVDLATPNIIPGVKKIVAYPALGTKKDTGDNWSGLLNQSGDAYIGAAQGASGANKDLGVTHVATMHTSTGRDYVVVVNRSGTDMVTVSAAPVMPKGNDGKGMMATTLAGDKSYQEIFTLPADSAHAVKNFKVDLLHCRVGNDIKFLQHQEKPQIGALRVIGDTVYVSVQGGRATLSNNDEAGIFSSRAIFNKYGAIIAWTPWERAYGFVDDASAKIGTFEVDRRTGQITSVVATTGKNTTTDSWTRNVADRLPIVLSEQFNDGIGVLGMFNFDADTPAFKCRDVSTATNKAKLQEYSLMVATGFGKVALIETGKKDTTNVKMVPTAQYELTSAGGDKPVHMFNKDGTDDALNALGPIITADVARAGEAGKGYLFVGGKGGVAVFRQETSGLGWDAKATTSMQGIVKPHVQTTFAQMKDTAGKVLFANTRKIIATQAYVFIMTNDSLYRVKIDEANFKAAGIDITAADKFRTLIGQATTPLTEVTVDGVKPFNSSDELYDMMLISNTADQGVLLVATSQGVFVVGESATKNDGVNAAAPTPTWARVKDTTTTTAQDFICGPAFKFELVSAATGGLFTADGGNFVTNATWLGNVYVTALDKDCKKLNVYRLAVDKDGATLIKEPYGTEQQFYTIGSYEKFARPAYFASEYDFQPQAVDFANHGVAGDFTVSELIPNPALFVQKQPINLNLDISSGLQLAQTVHDATGGITYAYGQFGVRALE